MCAYTKQHFQPFAQDERYQYCKYMKQVTGKLNCLPCFYLFQGKQHLKLLKTSMKLNAFVIFLGEQEDLCLCTF